MKYITFLTILLGNTPLFSQSHQQSETYAVVVGISDYQDEDIPDLRFADKDAEAFAKYLRLPAGGKLINENIKILFNQEATSVAFLAQQDWLVEEPKESDKEVNRINLD